MFSVIQFCLVVFCFNYNILALTIKVLLNYCPHFQLMSIFIENIHISFVKIQSNSILELKLHYEQIVNFEVSFIIFLKFLYNS